MARPSHRPVFPGCDALRMGTGEVPFVGHPMSVIGQHIHAAPTAPRLKNPELSSTLENLILSLLEKNPGRRPAPGNVVALALLEEAERRGVSSESTPDSIDGSGRARSNGRRRARRPRATRPRHRSRRTGRGGSVREASCRRRRASPPSGPPRFSGTTGSPPPLSGPPRASGSRRGATPGSSGHPIAREMLAKILSAPILISPEERYLCGHYLAYLLGGSRRRGIFLRRPLDARNADRARLLLAMTWLSSVEPDEEAIGRAGGPARRTPRRPAASALSW